MSFAFCSMTAPVWALTMPQWGKYSYEIRLFNIQLESEPKGTATHGNALPYPSCMVLFKPAASPSPDLKMTWMFFFP
jgi:hypothetical protein